jgi:gamma-glutamyl-gamma-aminobutyrate hydrolase PuuD
VPDVWGADAAEGHASLNGDYPLHALRPDTTTRFGKVLAEVTEVNTSHHQVIDPARIGQGLRVAARSGLGIIEAVELTVPGTRLCAVQWHPERLAPDHVASRTLIEHIRRL